MAIFHSKLFAGPNIVFNGDWQPDITIVAGAANTSGNVLDHQNLVESCQHGSAFPPMFSKST